MESLIILENKNINANKLGEYLEQNAKNKIYILKIVENIVYISTQELLEMVKRSFNKFVKEVPIYNLFIPSGKIGSEHYLMLNLRDKLNPVSIIKDNNIPTNDYPILIIDDAVLSSHNMCSHIDNLRYETGCKNKIYIVVGILSSKKVQVMNDKYFNAEIFADKIYDNLLPNSLFQNYTFEYFYENFKCETEFVIPVFFEHKIANEFGCYSFIKDIINKPVSRKIIDNITQNDIDNFLKSF